MQAKAALSRIRSDTTEQRHTMPFRSYQCEYCNGWHLTSKAWSPTFSREEVGDGRVRPLDCDPDVFWFNLPVIDGEPEITWYVPGAMDEFPV